MPHRNFRERPLSAAVPETARTSCRTRERSDFSRRGDLLVVRHEGRQVVKHPRVSARAWQLLRTSTSTSIGTATLLRYCWVAMRVLTRGNFRGRPQQRRVNTIDGRDQEYTRVQCERRGHLKCLFIRQD